MSDHIQVPRVWFHFWPDLSFPALLLLGFCRFSCGAKWDKSRAFGVRNSQLVHLLGYSDDTWQRAGAELDAAGLILRERTKQGYRVTLPARIEIPQNGLEIPQNGTATPQR
ncbi:MAG: hypothetical protein IID44_04790 [Planctomycetes bacterium]|nr:hypothetical protein [Planctomycetota bacterium]